MKRNMKLLVRVLCLLIACLTILALVVACDTDEKKGPTYKDNTKDRNGRVKDDLPDMDDDPSNDHLINFNGEVINLMYWQDVENPEFEQAEITGDNVRDAIYDRNVNVESRLNVDLNFIPVEVSYNVPAGSFLKHISAITDAGTHDYDIIATHSRTQGSLAVQGYLYNIAAIEDSYIDLEKPWWPAQLVDTVSFGNNDYYFISGDMSTNTLHMMHATFLNKDMFEELEKSVDDLYASVRSGDWTLDALIELTSDVYEDVDGDNVVSMGDRFGFTALHYVADSFYTAANLRYVEDSATDTLIVSPNYGSAKTVKLVNKLGAWAATDAVWLTSNSTSTADEKTAVRQFFGQKQALFWLEHVSTMYAYTKDVKDLSYGIVPIPKYDAKQLNYYTGMGNPFSLYGIFFDFDDRGDKDATLQMFSAVFECYASEAYRLTTPEVFEVNMQLKYAEGQNETDMFEIIRLGVVFDLGKIFGESLDLMSEKPSTAIAANSSWSSSYKSTKNSTEAKLKTIVDNFKRYQRRDQ